MQKIRKIKSYKQIALTRINSEHKHNIQMKKFAKCHEKEVILRIQENQGNHFSNRLNLK